VTVTISRLFDDRTAAMQAVGKLEAAGLPHSEISIVSSNADNWYSSDDNGARSTRGRDASGRVDRDRDGVDDRAEGAGTGAGIGAALGGAAGLLAGLGLLAIPGLGPVVAAGWLASTATVAAAGAIGGGVIGALTQAGVPEDEAHAYAEGVRRGGTLVTARVPEADRARYEAILDTSSVNIRDRSQAYRKAGWKKFDPSAPPFSAAEVQKEREFYRTHRGI
jgi:hypothetical protein